MPQQHCVDVQTTLCECFTNVVFQPKFQRCHKVVTMFRQSGVNIVAVSLSVLGTDIETPLGNICVNVVSMLGTDVGDHITFRQRCVNIVSTLVPNIVFGRFGSRMTVTFNFEFFTHLQSCF